MRLSKLTTIAALTLATFFAADDALAGVPEWINTDDCSDATYTLSSNSYKITKPSDCSYIRVYNDQNRLRIRETRIVIEALNGNNETTIATAGGDLNGDEYGIFVVSDRSNKAVDPQIKVSVKRNGSWGKCDNWKSSDDRKVMGTEMSSAFETYAMKKSTDWALSATFDTNKCTKVELGNR